MRDIRPGEVFREIPSPGFFIYPPDIWHPERIPPAALAAMQLCWRKNWFGPRAVRICVLEDVYVGFEGLVFTRTLEVVGCSIRQHAADEIETTRSAIARGGGIPRLAGDVVLARKRGAVNYGHWLVEMLPAAWLARTCWPTPTRVMVQAAAEPLRTVMRQSLELFGVEADGLLEVGLHPVLVDRLILVDGLADHGTYMSPLVMDCLRTITTDIAPAGAEPLLVTRGAIPSRRLIDEAAMLDAAARAGFDILDPAVLPFRLQVAAFKAARRVVGAMGAALSNLAFTEAGAEVAMLAPAGMQDTFFWFIGGLRDLHIVDIRCAQVPPQTGIAAWDTAIRVDDADRARILGAAPLAGERPRKTGAEMAALADRLFDPEYYRLHNPDVVASGHDPLWHYLEFGWREQRRPSARFDGEAYLRLHPDVAAANLNPLVHYIMYGDAEGRTLPA